MANIFQNFGSKVGNAFTNLGQGNSLLANQSQIANLSDEDKNKLRKQGLQKFADTMFLTSAIGSGDANKIALAQNRIRQRQLDEEEAKRKAALKDIINNSNLIPDSMKGLAEVYPEPFIKSILSRSGTDRKTIKGADGFNYYMDGTRVLPEVVANTETSKRKTIKGADGFNYFVDTGERVLPEVVKDKTSSDRKYAKAADGFYRYVDDGTKVFGDVEIPPDTLEITTSNVLTTQKEEKKTFDATNKGVKNFQQLLDAAKAADGAASYALMIKFIKQLDDSVVREGEVNTFGGFQGALTNLKNQISKTSGTGFTPKVKADMINLAALTANRLVNDYNIYRQGKEVSYKAIGFDPSMIFAGLDFNLGDLDLTKVYTPADFEIIEIE
tara:strand:+ start:3244 stop:4395 length:1152 start_codon:yes stop_codon:yes gene_type:complete